MWDKKIIAIAKLNQNMDFLAYIKKIINSSIDTLVLSRDDLSEFEYFDLAKEVLKICNSKNIQCILQNFFTQSLKLNHKFFCASLPLLRKEQRLYRYFHSLGTYVYFKEELFEAMMYKVNYAFVGNIFEDDKVNFEFLKEILDFSKIPLYLIGDINLQNVCEFKDLNIAGICINEKVLIENDLKTYIKELKKKLNE